MCLGVSSNYLSIVGKKQIVIISYQSNNFPTTRRECEVVAQENNPITFFGLRETIVGKKPIKVHMGLGYSLLIEYYKQ
jgi:hypothetical protein